MTENMSPETLDGNNEDWPAEQLSTDRSLKSALRQLGDEGEPGWSAEQLHGDRPEKKYLLILLPVHYKERLDETFPQVPFPLGIGGIKYDQGKLLRPMFWAWSKFKVGREPIIVKANYSDEPTTLKSTGEEIKRRLDEVPEGADIAAFLPSAGTAPVFVSEIDKELLDSDETVAFDQLFEESRINKAVSACSRARIGDPSYLVGYEESHPLYTESVELMDKYAKRLDDMVELGILAPEESKVWLGYMARNDEHVPEGTGIDTIPQIPVIVSKVEGHGPGVTAAMRDEKVIQFLRGNDTEE